MTSITPNYQLAAGHDNAGGLTALTSITDANGVKFLMPRGINSRNRGELRIRCDGSAARVGSDSQIWLFAVLTLAQYALLIGTYEGLVTIKTALTSVSFANYNATMIVPDENELEYGFLTGSPYTTGYVGPGYKHVPVRLIHLEAL